MFFLDFVLNIREEQGGFLQLLVQNPDISMNRVTDFGQSDDLACILLKLSKLFLVNIFDIDLSGTMKAMKIIFLLLTAF